MHLGHYKFESRYPQLKVKTISIQPKQPLPTTNSLVDDLYAFNAETSEDWNTGFMEIPSKMARITTRPRFTASTVPDLNEILSHVTGEDKVYDICGLNGLTSMDVIDHWEEEHGLEMQASVEEWNIALEEYEGADSEPAPTRIHFSLSLIHI